LFCSRPRLSPEKGGKYLGDKNCAQQHPNKKSTQAYLLLNKLSTNEDKQAVKPIMNKALKITVI
jgi:hypothetical protein